MGKKPTAQSKPTAQNKSSTQSKSKAKAKSAPNKKWGWFGFFAFLIKLSLVGVVLLGVALIYLDATLVKKFEGRRWQLPAKVFARPLELFVGQSLDAKILLSELENLHYSKEKAVTGPGQFSVQGQTFHIFTRGFQFWDATEPSRQVRIRFDGGEVGLVDAVHQDAKEEWTGVMRLEPQLVAGIYPTHNEDRILVNLDQLPPLFVEALLATEDRDFLNHFGISFRGIFRAMLVNVSSGELRQGGSTLTQQLVKNFYLTNERTLERKITEVLMSVLLEVHYSKKEILEAYLNEVFLGQEGSRAIHGFGMASYFYFGQPLSELKLHQSALLVALVKGASYYDPRKNPLRAKTRRDQIIDLIWAAGIVSEANAIDAKKESLGVIDKKEVKSNRYPAFLQLVQRQLKEHYQDEDLQNEGLRIFTTIDPYLQEAAERSVVENIKRLDQARLGRGEPLQAALIVSEPESGEVLAVVSGRDPKEQGFNRALDAVRQIGSVMKPIVYLAAFEESHYQLNSLLTDESIHMKQPNGDLWEPKNYDGQSHGLVLMQDALAQSYNLATVRLGLDIGLDRIAEIMKKMGVQRDIPEVPSLLLGSLALTPFEVAGVYQTIAANGFKTELKAIREVLNAEGKPLTRYPLQVKQIFKPQSIYPLQYAMQRVMWEGTGRAIYNHFPSDMGFAGKTGTTNDMRDSWFVGMSGNYLAVAWVGRDDNGQTKLTGATGALPVWKGFMTYADPKPFHPFQAEGMKPVWIDRVSGLISAKGCPNSVLVILKESMMPEGVEACAEKPFWDGWFERGSDEGEEL